MKSKLYTPIFSSALLLLPTMAFADFDFNLAGSSFKGIVEYLVSMLDIVIPILAFLAFAAFFWGLSKFILSGSGNQADLKKGKDYMMWGILALFILVSFQAIISLVSSELEIKSPDNTTQTWRPTLPE